MKNIIATPNGIEEVNLTAEEISEKEQIEQEGKVKQQEYETAKETRNKLKASAKAKLISGEALTEEEANTIVL